MKLDKINPKDKNSVNVIIETPKGSRNKYVFDEQLMTFKLKKTLSLGMTFPFDFGFIPNTKGGDGDPLDILVIMDEPAFAGCLIPCRLLGILTADQKNKSGKVVRNDRIVAIAESSIMYAGIKKLEELSPDLKTSIENFFTDYNKHEEKEFKPLGWKDAGEALKIIEQASK